MQKCTKKIESINLTACLNSLELKTKRLMVTAFVVCSFFLPPGQNDKNSNSAGLPAAKRGRGRGKAFNWVVALFLDFLVSGIH